MCDCGRTIGPAIVSRRYHAPANAAACTALDRRATCSLRSVCSRFRVRLREPHAASAADATRCSRRAVAIRSTRRERRAVVVCSAHAARAAQQSRTFTAARLASAACSCALRGAGSRLGTVRCELRNLRCSCYDEKDNYGVVNAATTAGFACRSQLVCACIGCRMHAKYAVSRFQRTCSWPSWSASGSRRPTLQCARHVQQPGCPATSAPQPLELPARSTLLSRLPRSDFQDGR